MGSGLSAGIDVVSTKKAYSSTSPLSQAIRCNGFLYCSGQVPVDPATGEVPSGIKSQTKQVIENLKAVLEAGGCEMADVVKTTIFLIDLGDFSRMNEVYGTYFKHPRPARTAVVVAGLARPEWRIEIELVAVLHE